jgi:hypothetical protein
MKSKRRHELQENTLSAEFGKIAEFVREHANTIGWSVLAAALIVFIIVWYNSRATREAERLNAMFDRAMTQQMSPAERISLLEQLVEQDDEESLAARASVELGNEYLARMVIAGQKDPSEWERLGQLAERSYRRVLDEMDDQPVAVAQAHLGMGRLAESRMQFETARAEYEAVRRVPGVTGHPVVMAAGRALRELERIDQPIAFATTHPAGPETQPATQPTAATERGMNFESIEIPARRTPATQPAPASTE